MTYDQAVDAARSGLLVTRPGLMEDCMGYDSVKGRLYTIDRRGHKAIFHPVREDRESTEWRLLR